MPEQTSSRSYHHGNLGPALLEAAERGLRTHGADQLSLRDLAREIGVSHAAPRRHFANRQELLDALAEAGFGRLGTALRTALAGTADDFADRLRVAATAYTVFATENAALLELMYSSKYRPDAERIRKAAEAPFGLMHELMLEGQRQGALRSDATERIGLVLFATLQGIASMINSKLIEAQRLDDLIDIAIEQFVQDADPPPADAD